MVADAIENVLHPRDAGDNQRAKLRMVLEDLKLVVG